MKKILFIFITLFALSSCDISRGIVKKINNPGNSQIASNYLVFYEVYDYLYENLKDPDSLKELDIEYTAYKRGFNLLENSYFFYNVDTTKEIVLTERMKEIINDGIENEDGKTNYIVDVSYMAKNGFGAYSGRKYMKLTLKNIGTTSFPIWYITEMVSPTSEKIEVTMESLDHHKIIDAFGEYIEYYGYKTMYQRVKAPMKYKKIMSKMNVI